MFCKQVFFRNKLKYHSFISCDSLTHNYDTPCMKFPKLGKRLDLPFVLQMERRKEKEAVFFFGDVSDKIIPFDLGL